MMWKSGRSTRMKHALLFSKGGLVLRGNPTEPFCVLKTPPRVSGQAPTVLCPVAPEPTAREPKDARSAASPKRVMTQSANAVHPF